MGAGFGRIRGFSLSWIDCYICVFLLAGIKALAGIGKFGITAFSYCFRYRLALYIREMQCHVDKPRTFQYMIPSTFQLAALLYLIMAFKYHVVTINIYLQP